LTVGLSSGTSGHRGVFLVGALETAAWAGVIVARALHRSVLHGERVAFFLRANSNLYERVGRGRLQFRYFDLMTPLTDAVAQLEAWQPTLLVAPPSLLLALARCHPRVRPHGVIAVAEVLEAQDRATLEAAFGVPIHGIYQATEGLIAVSCRCGRLHLQEDLIAVQLEAVPGDTSGTRFTPILTDLWRRTQPMVRYRLNDLLHLEPRPCPCGNPWRVVAQIEGRSDDTLEFHGATGATLVFPDIVRRAVLLASDAILEYTATQTEPNRLHVSLEVSAENETAALNAVRVSLERELRRYDIHHPRLEVSLGIARDAANIKLRRVKRVRALT
jgi:putative adenylate-forming enzyme